MNFYSNKSFTFYSTILEIITIKIVCHNLSFPGTPRIFIFRSYGYAKEKCFGNRKNLKSRLYTILIIIKSIKGKIFLNMRISKYRKEFLKRKYYGNYL